MLQKFIWSLKNNPGKRYRWLLVLGFVVVFFFFMFSDHGIYTRFSLESKKTELYESISQEQKNADSLQKIIKKLRTDTLEIERIAREKYGMIKPGEEVFRVSEPKEK